MSDRVRIGAVAYLNTRPLVLGLEQGLGRDRLELSYDVPSVLARRMADGEIDVGLLPVIELARIPDLEVAPGLSIASRGPAGSVLLVTRRDPSRIRRVGLDAESRTSNALVQVLFRRTWGARPEFSPAPGGLQRALAEYDAVLRIGDKALFEPLPQGASAIDLGRVWHETFDLPFVYAVWAARPGVLDRELYGWLHRSRRIGTRSIDAIAERYSWRGHRDPALARDYLLNNISFRLGAPELDGLNRFLAAAAELSLIERAPRIRPAGARWTACHETAAALGAIGRPAAVDERR